MLWGIVRSGPTLYYVGENSAPWSGVLLETAPWSGVLSEAAPWPGGRFRQQGVVENCAMVWRIAKCR